MTSTLATRIAPELQAHLRVDADAELARLLIAFDREEVLLIPAHLERHGVLLRRHHPSAQDAGPVLSISIGGSQSKAMLGSFAGGRLRVHWLRRLPNPTNPTPWQALFDELLLAEAPIRDYLASAQRPRIGVSLAVMITDGVPHHPTKMPGLSGLIARDLHRDAARCHFGRNLSAYLSSRHLPAAQVAYRSDGPLAHLGAVAAARPRPDERTMLLVCGTGMACADDRQFILTGLLPILDPHNPLHAHAETEQGQYQYLIAGKGLHSLMRRAVEVQSRWPGSLLGGIDASAYFASSDDSRKVRDLLHGETPADLAAALPADALDELRVVAEAIINRGVGAMAATTLASAAGTGATGAVRLFVEGGIATDPPIRQRLQRVLAQQAGRVITAAGRSYTLPHIHLDACVADTPIDPKVPAERAGHLDLTLWGAAALAATDDAVG
jgi:hypothetical protein